MPGIPEREAIHDRYSGYVIRVEDVDLLADFPYADADIVADGDVIVRYGIRLLGKPQICVVPDLVALDYGDMLTGEFAWEFLLKRSNLHPRADVLGYRNDGEDEMIVIKKLDLAAPIQVLVYPDTKSRIPLARPKAIIAGDLAGIPERLLEYLPRYETIDDWQATYHG